MSDTNRLMIFGAVFKSTSTTFLPCANSDLDILEGVAACFLHSYEPSLSVEITISHKSIHESGKGVLV